MRSDHADTCPALDQDRAPRHEGPEDDVRQLLVVAQQLDEPLAWDLDHLARVADHGGQIHTLAGQQVELTEEAVASVYRDHPVLGAVAAHDRDRPGLNDEEVIALVSLAEQDVAGRDRPQLTDGAQALTL